MFRQVARRALHRARRTVRDLATGARADAPRDARTSPLSLPRPPNGRTAPDEPRTKGQAGPPEPDRQTGTPEQIALPSDAPAERAGVRPSSTDVNESSGPPAALSGIAAMIQGVATGQAPEVDEPPRVSFTSAPPEEDLPQVKDEINLAEDGTPYWGPIDNESARLKAQGKYLVIDQEECIACGTCVENTDYVFVLPDDGKAVPIRQEGPMDLVQDAIDACPVTCIHWTDDPDQFPKLNDAEGNPLD